MADLHFEEPRLAQIYDPLDTDRSDLEIYLAIALAFGVGKVVDVGCGTGTLACMLERQGMEVIGLDPAQASLDVAKAKPDAVGVTWLREEAASMPALDADMVFMTGNAAQVFVTDSEWALAVESVHNSLRPDGGRFVFEIRNPKRRAWVNWTPEKTRKRLDIPGAGMVDHWHELLDVQGEFVTFRSIYLFEEDSARFESQSTLRFRDREAVEMTLTAAGFVVDEIRDAPDRPGQEFVFVAARNA